MVRLGSQPYVHTYNTYKHGRASSKYSRALVNIITVMNPVDNDLSSSLDKICTGIIGTVARHVRCINRDSAATVSM